MTAAAVLRTWWRMCTCGHRMHARPHDTRPTDRGCSYPGCGCLRPSRWRPPLYASHGERSRP